MSELLTAWIEHAVEERLGRISKHILARGRASAEREFKYDGGAFHVTGERVPSPKHAQILECKSRSRLTEAIISDSHSKLCVRFSGAATDEFAKLHSRHFGPDCAHGFISIRDFELWTSAHGDKAQSAYLLIKDFKWRGGKQPEVGRPKAILDSDSVKHLLTIIHPKDRAHQQPPESLGGLPASHGANMTPESEPVSPPHSQDLVSQDEGHHRLPLSPSQYSYATQDVRPGITSSYTEHRPERLGGVNAFSPVEIRNMPLNHSSGILALLGNHENHASTSHPPNAPVSDIVDVIASNVIDVDTDSDASSDLPIEEPRKPPTPPLNAKRGSLDSATNVSLAGRQAIAASPESPEQIVWRHSQLPENAPRRSLYEGNFRFTQQLPDNLRIPSDQRQLLDQSHSWQHPQPGHVFPGLNIPRSILTDFKQLPQRQKSSSIRSGARINSRSEASVGESGPDMSADDSSDSDEPSGTQISWSLSPPIRQRPSPSQLPPDSSAAMIEPERTARHARPPSSSPPFDLEDEQKLRRKWLLSGSQDLANPLRIENPHVTSEVLQEPDATDQMLGTANSKGSSSSGDSSGKLVNRRQTFPQKKMPPRHGNSRILSNSVSSTTSSSAQIRRLDPQPSVQLSKRPDFSSQIPASHVDYSHGLPRSSPRSETPNKPANAKTSATYSQKRDDIALTSSPAVQSSQRVLVPATGGRMRSSLGTPYSTSAIGPIPDSELPKWRVQNRQRAIEDEPRRPAGPPWAGNHLPSRAHYAGELNMKRKFEDQSLFESNKRRNVCSDSGPESSAEDPRAIIARQRREWIDNREPKVPSKPRTEEPPQTPRRESGTVTIFAHFKKSYPDYDGDLKHFLGRCKSLHALLQKRTFHESLWDDYVVVHKMSYLPYFTKCAQEGEDGLHFDEYLPRQFRGPRNMLRVLTRDTLGTVLGPSSPGREASASEALRSTPSKVVSHQLPPRPPPSNDGQTWQTTNSARDVADRSRSQYKQSSLYLGHPGSERLARKERDSAASHELAYSSARTSLRGTPRSQPPSKRTVDWREEEAHAVKGTAKKMTDTAHRNGMTRIGDTACPLGIDEGGSQQILKAAGGKTTATEPAAWWQTEDTAFKQFAGRYRQLVSLQGAFGSRRNRVNVLDWHLGENQG